MSKVSRIEMLKSFIEEEPDNPFNYFALALEILESDPPSASYYFKRLLSEFPDYLPTYYHAAAFFDQRIDNESVIEIYKKGIALSESQKDQKTNRELNNSFQNFLFENDIY